MSARVTGMNVRRRLARLRKPGDLVPARLVGRVEFPYRAPMWPGTVEREAPPRRTGVHYDTSWARGYPARVARAGLMDGVVRPAVHLLARPDRRGADRLDGLSGPAIFAPNHHSHLDTPLVLTSIPEPWRHRMVVGAAADYFFRTRATAALSSLVFNAIPIERARVNRRSADLATDLIARGWSLLVFPEGGRSPDGWGQPFRGGAAFVSLRVGRPVVPMHVGGSRRILGKGQRMPRPGVATVTIGAPLFPEEGEDARAFTTRIEGAVAALADERETDWWSARRRAATGATPALRGPDVGGWRRAWSLSRGDTAGAPPTWPPLD